VVEYSFRDYEKNLKSLEMIITGRMEDPQIAFEMNNSKIDEQDALSYIVFGCSTAELSEGQESTLDISTSTIAKNVAFGQMSSVLQDAVQNSLKLDVVEIAGEDNWDAASVTVGKYINNNLYMSYQYTFALDKKTKIMEPQKISVEYQFYKFLSLKATNQSPNSGLDFIYKKEYK
jgi:translocation and assembly module TamB